MSYKDELLDRAKKTVDERNPVYTPPAIHTLADIAKEAIEDQELENYAPKTGLPELDRLIKGFIPGHVYMLAGDTNVGKTSLACNFVERLRRQGRKTLYFALEPDIWVTHYLQSCHFCKPFDMLTKEEISFDDGLVHVYKKPDIPDLDTLVKTIEFGTTYPLVVIDHLGYFLTSERNPLQEQANTMKVLAQLAKEKKTAFLIIVHLNKSKIDNKTGITMNHISGSASFKQDATEVLLVSRKVNDDGKAERVGVLKVAKTKKGPNGVVPLIFNDRSAYITTPEENSMIAVYQREAQRQTVENMTEEEVKGLF